MIKILFIARVPPFIKLHIPVPGIDPHYNYMW